MNFLLKFLIDIILYFKNMLKAPDYSIISRELEYWVKKNDDGEEHVPGTFWRRQMDEWDGETETYAVDLDEDECVPEPPDAVSKTVFRVKYWLNNRIHKYLTYDRNYKWPPKEDLRFCIPLMSAKLLDQHGKPVKDILDKVRRYRGSEKVKIADMFYYDDETLKNELPKIELTNILGQKKIISTVDGYVTDLQLP